MDKTHTHKPRSLSAELILRVARYTQMVLVGKWTLGVVSLVIILVIIIIPLLEDKDKSARISFVSTSAGIDGKAPAMIKPKLQGVSDNNEPYTATADRAEQLSKDEVRFFNLQADLTRADNSWLNVTAKEGLYNSARSLLILTGNVVLYEDSGYMFTSQRVDIDTEKAAASGDGVIEGQGPLGNMRATGYLIAESGAVMKFGQKGRVTVRVVK